MADKKKVNEGLELCLKGLCDICPYNGSDAPGGCKDELMYDAMILLEAQEPRVMTLEAAKEARICWIEERDVGIVYPAIYECIGNPSKCGRFSVFTVVSDTDILPEEFDDDDRLVCDFEEGHRWLWEADHNDVWRCWTSRPTDAQREAVKWD